MTGVQTCALPICVPPQLTLSAASLEFGNQAVNVTSAPKTFTIRNTGYGDATLSNLNVRSIIPFGPNNIDQYSMTNDCGSLPRTLAVGAFCTVTVTFKPTSTGNKAGPYVNINVPNGTTVNGGFLGTAAVALTGTGAPAVMGFTWSATEAVGNWATNAGARTIVVTNTGLSASTLANNNPVRVANSTQTQFSLVTNGTTCTAGKVLQPNQSCDVIVSRNRNNNNSARGSLIVTTSNMANATATQNLTGN